MNLPKIDPNEWIESHVGRIWDIDGAYGVQCVDLYKIFLKDIGYPNYNGPIGGDGWAHSIWYNREALGLGKYFDFIQGPLKVGDIVIWGKGSSECPDSHVAMYAGDAEGVNRALIFGSNQGTPHSAGNILNLSCTGALGALRYKGFTTGWQEMTEEAPAQPAVPAPIEEGVEGSIYRLYNPANGDHLYTPSYDEATACHKAGWKYEGIAWIAPASGSLVMRLYNPGDGTHHYTADQDEIRGLQALGWALEGAAFRSGGGRPIWRMYNPNGGGHILTASGDEHRALTGLGWACEGQPLSY